MFKGLKKQIEGESGALNRARPMTHSNPRRLTADFSQFASAQRVPMMSDSQPIAAPTTNNINHHPNSNDSDPNPRDNITIANLQSKITTLEKNLEVEKDKTSKLEKKVEETKAMLTSHALPVKSFPVIEKEEMQNRYDTLLKAYEDYRTKTNDLLAKKDAHIHRLQERVTNLESKLDGPDRLHSLTTERNLLQEKLENLQTLHNEEMEKWQSSEANLAELKLKNEKNEAELLRLSEARVDTEEVEKLRNMLELRTDDMNEQTALLKLQDEKLAQLCSQLDVVEQERNELAARVEEFESSPVADPDQIKEFVQEAAQDYIETMDIQSEQHITTLANHVEDLQTTLEDRHRDLNALNRELNDKETLVEKLSEKIKSSEGTNSRQQDVIESLREEVDHQKDRAREACRERDDLLLRNASLAHEMEIVKSNAERDRVSIEAQLNKLSQKLEEYKSKFDQSDEGNGRLELEENVKDKDAQIKQLQSRLNEMKKILGKELRKNNVIGEDSDAASEDGFGGLGRMRPLSMVSSNPVLSAQEHVNDQYLKHVLLRFVTGTDVESGQLVRAVATLLHLSPVEEQFIWDTLAWKSSWVPGPRPTLTSYQVNH